MELNVKWRNAITTTGNDRVLGWNGFLGKD